MSSKLMLDEEALSLKPVVSPSLRLLRIIGSPFASGREAPYSREEALELYNLAAKNKISLLYLETLWQQGSLHELAAKYEEEKAKYLIFINEVAKLSKLLEGAQIEFTTYKTVKPYPALLGDIDIITLGGTDTHRKTAEMLLRAHYEVGIAGVINTETVTDDDYETAARLATRPTSHNHEHISPTSTNFIAPGNGILVDLRKELAMNYTIYMDKNNFRSGVIRTRLSNEEEIRTLAPEFELAIAIGHSLSEQLYLLGDFCTFLWHLSKMEPRQIDELINIVKENRITVAARAFMTLTSGLCWAAYGVIPEKVYMLSEEFGFDAIESRNLIENNFTTPRRYRLITIARFLLEKIGEGKFRRSALIQCLSMLNPAQAKLVISELILKRRREIY